jgi:N-methylhydantoinase A
VFACTMAKELGIRKVLVPPSPGLFSAFGLLYAEVEHHHGRTFRRLLKTMELDLLNNAWATMELQARAELEAEGFAGDRVAIRRLASLHYQGQTFDLTVPVPEGALGPAEVAAIEEAFGREHERTYGHRAGADEPVELTEIRITARGIADRAATPQGQSFADAPARRARDRAAYFGPEVGWLETPVLARAHLATPRQGPCIIEEYDATCVVPPGAQAALDAIGSILIEL